MEKIINHRLLGEKRKKQRDRVSSGRSQEPGRKENRAGRQEDRRNDITRRSDARREIRPTVHQRERRDGWEERRLSRYDERNRHDDGRRYRERDQSRRITLAAATVDDLWEALEERQVNENTNLYDSSSEGSIADYASEWNSDSDSDYMEAGSMVNRPQPPHGRTETSRPHQVAPHRADLVNRSDSTTRPDSMTRSDSTSRSHGPIDQNGRSERRNRPNDSREKRSYGPCGACGASGHDAHYCRRRCKFCKQVHEVGRCELFAQYEKLAKFVKTSVDKSVVPDELQDIYSSSHLN